MDILDLIKAQCAVQNVPTKFAELIKKISGIEDEKAGNIIAAVKSFKENIFPIMQKKEDAVDDAVKKAIADYEAKHGLKDGKSIKTEEENKDEDNQEPELKGMDETTKALFKKQSDDIAKLTDALSKLTKTFHNNTSLENVRTKLKGKIDDEFIDRYAKRVNLDAENLDAEIENVVNEFNEDKQAFLNEAVASGNYQPVEGGASVSSDKDIDEYIESKTKLQESDGFAGIKI